MLRHVVITLLCVMAPMWARADTDPFVTFQEVVSGMPAAPGVSYVVLHVVIGGDLSGWGFYTYDTANPPAGSTVALLKGDWSNVPDDSFILLATPQAEAFFHVAADTHILGVASESLLMVQDWLHREQASFPYGTATDPHFTTVNAFNWAGGIVAGQVAQRLMYSSTATVNNAARDFHFVDAPWPINSEGAVGFVTGTCGNGVLEALEACDDGANNGSEQDTCTALCTLRLGAGGSVCGNAITEVSEQCDDGNLMDGDGCSSTCRWESLLSMNIPSCGNHLLETQEQCDPPVSGVCDANCHLLTVARCGDGSVEAGEQCDDGAQNGAAGDACSSTCLWTAAHPLSVCGNGRVEVGEDCDAGVHNDPPNANLQDANVYHSGCSQQCTTETARYWSCGDDRVDPGEACDLGADNGVVGSPCTATCTLVNPPAPYDPNAAAQGSTASTSTSTSTGSSTSSTGGPATGGTGTSPTTGGVVVSGTGGTPGKAPQAVHCADAGALPLWALLPYAWRRARRRP